MKLGQIDFPDAIIQAIREDRLVVFAGVGVFTEVLKRGDDFNWLWERVGLEASK